MAGGEAGGIFKITTSQRLLSLLTNQRSDCSHATAREEKKEKTPVGGRENVRKDISVPWPRGDMKLAFKREDLRGFLHVWERELLPVEGRKNMYLT